MKKKLISAIKVTAFLGLGILLIWLSMRQLKPATAKLSSGKFLMTSAENWTVGALVFNSDSTGKKNDVTADGVYTLSDSSALEINSGKISKIDFGNNSAESAEKILALVPSDFFNIKKSLSNANYWWLGLSMLICVLSHLIRAYRWNMLLEPMGYKAKFSNSFFAVMIGYLVNYGVPRLGEVSRCTVLDRYEKIPFTKGFGTVVAERVIDMIIFFILFFLMLSTQYDKIAKYMGENITPVLSEKWEKISHNTTLLILLGAGGIIFIAAIFYFRKKIKGKLGEKVKGFAKGFGEGLRAVGKVKNPVAFIGLSVSIWLCYYLMLHLCFYCLTESSHLSFSEGLTGMVFGTFTVMLTPGGIGAYPLAMQKVFNKIYFLAEPVGFAVGWLSWLSGFIVIVILGLLSFVMLPILNKNENDSAA